MKIGNKYDATHVLQKQWKQLCEDVNYRYLAMIDLIEKLGDKIKKAAILEKEQLEAQGITHPILDKIIHVIKKNIDHIVS